SGSDSAKKPDDPIAALIQIDGERIRPLVHPQRGRQGRAGNDGNVGCVSPVRQVADSWNLSVGADVIEVNSVRQVRGRPARDNQPQGNVIPLLPAQKGPAKPGGVAETLALECDDKIVAANRSKALTIRDGCVGRIGKVDDE